MFDNTDFTAAGSAPPPPPEPPKPRRWRVDDWTAHVNTPSWLYALKGPDGWYSAVVTKEPIPGAYTLTIQSIDYKRPPIFEDAFSWYRGFLTDGQTWFNSLSQMLSQILHYITGSASDWTMTQYPVPEEHWISLCEDGGDGELRGQGGMFCLHHYAR